MRLFRPALISLLFLLAAAPGAAERMTLGVSGHLMTQVRLNGAGPFDFVVDTCASDSSLVAGMAERLRLHAVGGAQAQVHGASGIGTAALFRLDRIVVDGRTRGPLTMPGFRAQPGAPPLWAGVIGVDVLSAYVADFDVPRGRFRLLDPATDLAAAGAWARLPFLANRAGFPVLQGSLDGQPMHILFDTGARRTLINWPAARLLGLVPGGSGLAAAEPVGGATVQRIAAVKHAFGTIAIGGLSIPAGEIVIADLPVFGPLGWVDQPAMILGMDRMGALHFAVDYPRSRLLVARSPG
jgi:predicted aspartyl protease